MSTVMTAHIHLDQRGVAWIDNMNVKVIEVALDQIGQGLSAQEIYIQHNRYLSLAQIHAALSYYYDHQAEFDAEIERQVREVEEFRAQSLDTPGRRRLRALGHLP